MAFSVTWIHPYSTCSTFPPMVDYSIILILCSPDRCNNRLAHSPKATGQSTFLEQARQRRTRHVHQPPCGQSCTEEVCPVGGSSSQVCPFGGIENQTAHHRDGWSNRSRRALVLYVWLLEEKALERGEDRELRVRHLGPGRISFPKGSLPYQEKYKENKPQPGTSLRSVVAIPWSFPLFSPAQSTTGKVVLVPRCSPFRLNSMRPICAWRLSLPKLCAQHRFRSSAPQSRRRIG